MNSIHLIIILNFMISSCMHACIYMKTVTFNVDEVIPKKKNLEIHISRRIYSTTYHITYIYPNIKNKKRGASTDYSLITFMNHEHDLVFCPSEYAHRIERVKLGIAMAKPHKTMYITRHAKKQVYGGSESDA